MAAPIGEERQTLDHRSGSAAPCTRPGAESPESSQVVHRSSTPPYDYDLEIPDDLCLMCAVNICGLCEEAKGEPCRCSHGVEWPAENPWAALWSFGPGTLGYSGAMALAASDAPAWGVS